MSTPTPHHTVVEDAAAKIAALEHALELATSRAGSGAEAQANAIIAAARKEAFQLITGARTEAGLVIAEARSEAEQFQQQQPQAVAPAPRPDSQGAEALRAEELRLEARIVELQSTLAGLESGIRSLTGMLATSGGAQPVETVAASPPPPAFANHPSSQPITLEGEHETTTPVVINNGGEALVEPLLPPQRTFSASPPPPPSEPEPAAAVLVEDLTVEVADQYEQVPAPEGGSRASFYSRRSAQLPHIGADAGRSAIQAAAGLRLPTGDRVAGKSQA
jgi:hypothetical protein